MPYPDTQTFKGIPIGLEIRGSINDEYTFRVRRGNGYYGSVLGKKYQEKYPYVIPGSINNPEGEAARSAFATAVSNWQSVITDDEKAAWRKRARSKGKVSGYNLYIGNYVQENS